MARDFTAEMAQAKALVEDRLGRFFSGDDLQVAMRYSLLAGGKRIRPILTLKFCRAAGGREEDALDLACTVEMLHTYSLIHDDLPCMDNDDLRRGKPTCHKVYGETAAVLAGDALQAAAFQTALQARGLSAQARTQAALALAQAAGPEGMCLGQYWDTVGREGPHSPDRLLELHDHKTGELLRAACVMGVIAAASGRGEPDSVLLDAAKDYATHLGLAFQIRDDVLDVTGSEEALGKPIGSDAALEKCTYVTLAGLPASEKAIEDHTRQAGAALERASWPGDTAFLSWLADRLARRDS